MLITRDVQIGLQSEDVDCNGAATGSYSGIVSRVLYMSREHERERERDSICWERAYSVSACILYIRERGEADVGIP